MNMAEAELYIEIEDREIARQSRMLGAVKILDDDDMFSTEDEQVQRMQMM
jgi:hypothetical protein